jgi:hypothetical protein
MTFRLLQWYAPLTPEFIENLVTLVLRGCGTPSTCATKRDGEIE